MANSVDPDETPHSAASHLGLYCLLSPVCPNIYGKYGNPVVVNDPIGLNCDRGSRSLYRNNPNYRDRQD